MRAVGRSTISLSTTYYYYDYCRKKKSFLFYSKRFVVVVSAVWEIGERKVFFLSFERSNMTGAVIVRAEGITHL